MSSAQRMNPSEKCQFCRKIDVVESGSYSGDLSSAGSEEKKLWFCCVLHNQMYRHRKNISPMPQSVYDNEIKYLQSRNK
jgi:hypothetical protein